MPKVVLSVNPSDSAKFGSVASNGAVSVNAVVFTESKAGDGTKNGDPRK